MCTNYMYYIHTGNQQDKHGLVGWMGVWREGEPDKACIIVTKHEDYSPIYKCLQVTHHKVRTDMKTVTTRTKTNRTLHSLNLQPYTLDICTRYTQNMLWIQTLLQLPATFQWIYGLDHSQLKKKKDYCAHQSTQEWQFHPCCDSGGDEKHGRETQLNNEAPRG